AEVSVARRPRRHRLAEEREILLAVVADREEVVGRRPEPAVAGAVGELDPTAVVAVVGIAVLAALPLGRERIGRVRHAAPVDVLEPGLEAVAAGEPAQEVVVRAVLHHHDDDVLDARRLGVGKRQMLDVGGVAVGAVAAAADHQRAGRSGEPREELAAGQLRLGLEIVLLTAHGSLLPGLAGRIFDVPGPRCKRASAVLAADAAAKAKLHRPFTPPPHGCRGSGPPGRVAYARRVRFARTSARWRESQQA